MSYYDTPSWQSPSRQSSWEQPTPPLRSGTGSASQPQETPAFRLQLEEIERALDNLNQNGKMFAMPMRRESVSMGPRPFSEYNTRTGGHHSRHHSVGDFDPMRSHSGANLQNFYANQRFQPRHTEAEQMQQAKRRMAAQRERELRNYHQEQQYHRKISAQGKPERSSSPNAMNEEDRRELIARQHRALYGADSASFYGAQFDDDNSTPRPTSQAAQGAPGQAPPGKGQSPLSYNAFGMPSDQHSSGMDSSNHYPREQTTKGPSPKQPQPTRSRANSTASPASNTQNYGVFEHAAQQSSRTSTSSPGGSPPRPGKNGVAPIGTRPLPSQAQAMNPVLQKRSTTPLPSPLSFGFAPGEGQSTMPATSLAVNERSTSAASNPTVNNPKENVGLNWGSSSGVWGKNPLGVQASVWG